MCFTKVTRSKRMIADKDIICYKIIKFKSKNSGTALYFSRFKYQFGVLNIIPAHKTTLIGKQCEINIGFHSYRFYRDIESRRLKKRLPNIIKNLGDINYFSLDEVAVRCVIPKGSFYWMNHNQYVSNKIIVKEYVK